MDGKLFAEPETKVERVNVNEDAEFLIEQLIKLSHEHDNAYRDKSREELLKAMRTVNDYLCDVGGAHLYVKKYR